MNPLGTPSHRTAARAAFPTLGLAAVATFAALAACDRPSRAPANPPPVAADAATRVRRATVAQPPGYVVDSLIPIGEALRRFRAGVPEMHALTGGAPSRDELVARFVRAVERADTAALRRMELTRAEFAYLLYPSSPFTRRPFRQQPEVAWLLQRTAGDAGLGGLLRNLAGRPLDFGGYECALAPVVEGENRLWRRCRVSYRTAAGSAAAGSLFGVIVERAGRFKFVNYANDL